jgi:hypothetical protein
MFFLFPADNAALLFPDEDFYLAMVRNSHDFTEQKHLYGVRFEGPTPDSINKALQISQAYW